MRHSVRGGDDVGVLGLVVMGRYVEGVLVLLVVVVCVWLHGVLRGRNRGRLRLVRVAIGCLRLSGVLSGCNRGRLRLVQVLCVVMLWCDVSVELLVLVCVLRVVWPDYWSGSLNPSFVRRRSRRGNLQVPVLHVGVRERDKILQQLCPSWCWGVLEIVEAKKTRQRARGTRNILLRLRHGAGGPLPRPRSNEAPATARPPQHLDLRPDVGETKFACVREVLLRQHRFVGGVAHCNLFKTEVFVFR